MRLDLELYRKSIETAPGVCLSVIDVAPERPLQTFVLLHGLGGDATQWNNQFNTFGHENRVVAIDLRGHGNSTRPESDYRMDTLVNDVMAVLDTLNIRQPVALIGHSFGVAVATEIASRTPERVRRLILIAGAGAYQLSATYKWAFRMPDWLLDWAQPLISGRVNASLTSLKQMYADTVADWQGWELFPTLTMPVMVIMGRSDKLLPQEDVDRVGELVPRERSELLTVDVSAHMVMLERGDAVDRAIARFVAPDDGVARFGWRSNVKLDGRGVLLRERPWLAHYEDSVPATIDVPDVALPRLLERAVERFPDRTALVFERRELTWRRVGEQVAQCANTLRSLGVGPGDQVLILLPNIPQMVVAYYATLTIGAVVVLLNTVSSAETLLAQLATLEPKVLVAFTRFQDQVTAVRETYPDLHIIYAGLREYMTPDRALLFGLGPEHRNGHRLKHELGERDYRWSKLLKKHDKEVASAEIDPRALAVIQFSSGTEEQPKGVMLSQRNLVANTLQLRGWLTDTRDGQETTLCVVPFSHAYGMTAALNISVSMAATMLLLARFDTDDVLLTIKRYSPTFFPGVPAMYVAINEHPNVRSYNLRAIKACISGSDPLPVEVEEAFEKLTRGNLVEGYGLTEASPVTHVSPLHGRDKAGSIGLPLPGTEARIVDLATGAPLEAGAIGELLIRGPQVMLGYWQDEEATAEAIDAYGWLHTGDIARMDADGFFQIVSRRRDVWLGREGAIFYPRDVEEVIIELPEVREAVVVAIRNRPVAFVQRKPGATISSDSIHAYCQRRLPEEYVPRRIVFVSQFPRNLLGKVLRRDLEERDEG